MTSDKAIDCNSARSATVSTVRPASTVVVARIDGIVREPLDWDIEIARGGFGACRPIRPTQRAVYRPFRNPRETQREIHPPLAILDETKLSRLRLRRGRRARRCGGFAFDEVRSQDLGTIGEAHGGNGCGAQFLEQSKTGLVRDPGGQKLMVAGVRKARHIRGIQLAGCLEAGDRRFVRARWVLVPVEAGEASGVRRRGDTAGPGGGRGGRRAC